MTSSFIHTYVYTIYLCLLNRYTWCWKQRRRRSVGTLAFSAQIAQRHSRIRFDRVPRSRRRLFLHLDFENSRTPGLTIRDRVSRLWLSSFALFCHIFLSYGFIVSSRSIISRVYRIFAIFYGEYMYVYIYVRLFVIRCRCSHFLFHCKYLCFDRIIFVSLKVLVIFSFLYGKITLEVSEWFCLNFYELENF